MPCGTPSGYRASFRALSQTALSEALGRPVTFRQVDFRVRPVGPPGRREDRERPALGPEPFLEAEELSIGGGVSLTGQELRLGRIRALRPKVSLVSSPTGLTTCRPGSTGPRERGGEDPGGRRSSSSRACSRSTATRWLSDVAWKTSTETSPPSGKTTTAGSRRTEDGRSASRPPSRSLLGPLDRFPHGAGAGGRLESLRSGLLRAAVGGRRDRDGGRAAKTTLSLRPAELSIWKSSGSFNSNLGFDGNARIEARGEIPAGGDFRIAGKARLAAHRRGGIPPRDVEAVVTRGARSSSRGYERGRYAGGERKGSFGSQASSKSRETHDAREGKGLSLERFFGDPT